MFGRTATSLVFVWLLSAVVKVAARPGSSGLAARVWLTAKNVSSQARRKAVWYLPGRIWRVRWLINWRRPISHRLNDEKTTELLDDFHHGGTKIVDHDSVNTGCRFDLNRCRFGRSRLRVVA